MDVTTYVNLVLVLIGFVTLYYNKRQTIINDAPRIVVKKTSVKKNIDEPSYPVK